MDPQSSWERATMANGIQEREIDETPSGSHLFGVRFLIAIMIGYWNDTNFPPPERYGWAY